MPEGGGKYEVECAAAREAAQAQGAGLIIIEGKKGSGFSLQMPPEILPQLPKILRNVADQIEADLPPPHYEDHPIIPPR